MAEGRGRRISARGVEDGPGFEPVNGIVQPPFVPGPGQGLTTTNRLLHIKKVLLPMLKTHSYAGPFLHPVDAVLLRIPDYHSVIKRPMDLGTIEKRLNNNYYQSARECVEDFRTMFQNCFVYNPPNHPVFTQGKALQAVFEGKVAQMARQLPIETREKVSQDGRYTSFQTPSNGTPLASIKVEPVEKVAGVVEYSAAISENPLKMKLRVVKKEETGVVSFGGRTEKTSPDLVSQVKVERSSSDGLKPLSKQELSELSNDIYIRLPGAEILKVLDILRSCEPALMTDPPDEFEMTVLKPATQHKLKDFMAEYNRSRINFK